MAAVLPSIQPRPADAQALKAAHEKLTHRQSKLGLIVRAARDVQRACEDQLPRVVSQQQETNERLLRMVSLAGKYHIHDPRSDKEVD